MGSLTRPRRPGGRAPGRRGCNILAGLCAGRCGGEALAIRHHLQPGEEEPRGIRVRTLSSGKSWWLAIKRSAVRRSGIAMFTRHGSWTLGKDDMELVLVFIQGVGSNIGSRIEASSDANPLAAQPASLAGAVRHAPTGQAPRLSRNARVVWYQQRVERKRSSAVRAQPVPDRRRQMKVLSPNPKKDTRPSRYPMSQPPEAPVFMCIVCPAPAAPSGSCCGAPYRSGSRSPRWWWRGRRTGCRFPWRPGSGRWSP